MLIERREFLAGIAAAATAASWSVPAQALQQQQPRVRRDLAKLRPNDPFFSRYALAVRRMHQLPRSDPRNWVRQSKIHLDHCPHGSVDFFPWHRHYLHRFEEACRSVLGDPSFSLAYWDWTASNGILPAPFYDIRELTPEYWRDSSVIESPRGRVNTRATRDLPKNTSLLSDVKGAEITEEKVLLALQKPDFDGFRRTIEGTQHNNVHNICGGGGGHMSNAMSPLDPVFWVHHCNVDRLWAQWQDAGNRTPTLAGNYGGQFYDGRGAVVARALASEATDYRRFGYVYDRALAPVGRKPDATKSFLQDEPTGRRSITSVAEPRALASGRRQAIALPAAGLAEALSERRRFRSAKTVSLGELQSEKGRVYAVLSGVERPRSASPLLVQVFVSDAGQGAAATGKQSAGSFSFFGAPEHHSAASEFEVEVTEPLRILQGGGALRDGRIRLEFEAVSASTGAPLAGTEIAVGSVALVSG